MTERLADIGVRIDGIRQLGAVVNAMRGIAAARAQQARGQLGAVDSYTATIAHAIGQAMTLGSADRPGAGLEPMRPALVLFCAEQGFAGAFSERVFDAVRADLGGCQLFLIGARGAAVADQRSVKPAWTSAMPSHSQGVSKLADHIAQALYAHIAMGEIDRLDVAFSEWRPGDGVHVERQPLLPLNLSQFPAVANANAPLVNLTPNALLEGLTADYLHAQLCHAALHAFAAENEARMETMAAAHSQIDRQLAALQATQRLVRQEEITAEIIELAAGETASRRVSVRPPRKTI